MLTFNLIKLLKVLILVCCRQQMPATIDGQMTVEKTPSYFVTRAVPQRIHKMAPHTKLILVVRDPVTRAISDYTQTVIKRPGMRPFEQMAILDNITGMVNTSWGAIKIGMYSKHLERWLKYFDLKQIHFVSGERLISDPVGELQKVEKFLKLKPVISDEHFFLKGTKGFPCLLKDKGKIRCLGKTKGRTHPKINNKVLSTLKDFYKPFNAKFTQITNINFGWH